MSAKKKSTPPSQQAPNRSTGPITGKALAGLSKFAHPDKERTVLAALCFRPDSVAACDGYRLGIIHGTVEMSEAPKRDTLIRWADIKPWLPKAQRYIINPGAGPGDAAAVEAELTPGGPMLRNESVPTINGTFPNVEQVIPQRSAEPLFVLNARYLRDLCDLAIALNPGNGRGSSDLPIIRVFAPAAPDKPVRLEAAHQSYRVATTTATAVIMPVVEESGCEPTD